MERRKFLERISQTGSCLEGVVVPAAGKLNGIARHQITKADIEHEVFVKPMKEIEINLEPNVLRAAGGTWRGIEDILNSLRPDDGDIAARKTHRHVLKSGRKLDGKDTGSVEIRRGAFPIGISSIVEQNVSENEIPRN